MRLHFKDYAACLNWTFDCLISISCWQLCLNSTSNMLGKKRLAKLKSIPSMDSRSLKRPKLCNDVACATKDSETSLGESKSAYAWLNNTVENGYIYHPRAGWIIHPSFYDEDEPLCDAKAVCRHERDCKEIRMRMAVFAYIRAEQRNTPLSYREVELLWGVSHSTVQRRKLFMELQSDVWFLMTPMKKVWRRYTNSIKLLKHSRTSDE